MNNRQLFVELYIGKICLNRIRIQPEVSYIVCLCVSVLDTDRQKEREQKREIERVKEKGSYKPYKLK